MNRSAIAAAVLLGAAASGCWENPIKYENPYEIPMAARGEKVRKLYRELAELEKKEGAPAGEAAPAAGQP